MTQKYFIGKCGGEDCPKRGDIDEACYCNIDGDYCDEERCQNCPHGKTIDEMAEAMAKGTHKGYELQEGYHFVVEDTTKDNILGLKALLGGEE